MEKITLTQDELDSIKESSYENGQRMLLTRQMGAILHELGYDSKTKLESLILEREEMIASLRSACEDHGDNDWDETLHLSDILNKHLMRHIDE